MRTQDKVLIGLAVLVAASALAMSGSSGAEPYLDVHHVTSDADPATGVLSVKGEVVANTTIVEDQTVTFLLADASGDATHENETIRVRYEGVLPDAFGPKMVVVTGTLVEGADGMVLQATDIQVGCSSKY